MAVMTSSSPLAKKKLLKPITCGLMVCIGSFLVGAAVVYPSPAIPNLDSNRNPFHLDSEQTSWIGGVVSLGALLGGLIGGPLMDKIGRKLALMVCAAPFSVTWVVVVAAPNFAWLLVGRVLTGVCVGVYSVICPIYLGEIAPASIRGLLGSCHQLAVCVGTLYVYVLGAFLSWTWLAVAISAVNLILVAALAFIPETPRWLMSKGRKDDALFALEWLQGDGANVHQELEVLQEALRRSEDKAGPMELLRPQLMKPLLISLGLMVFHQFCGSKAVSIYTVRIFQMSRSGLDPHVQTIVVGAMGVVGNLVAVVLADFAGRKVLLVVSAILMTLTMACMGTFFYMLESFEFFTRHCLAWMPMVGLMVFNFGYNVALGPISWLIMSELFPLRAKGVASGFSVAFNWLLSFVVTKCFINIAQVFHPYGGFWMCAAFCVLSVPFVVVCVPETKGMTLEELQKGFR